MSGNLEGQDPIFPLVIPGSELLLALSSSLSIISLQEYSDSFLYTRPLVRLFLILSFSEIPLALKHMSRESFKTMEVVPALRLQQLKICGILAFLGGGGRGMWDPSSLSGIKPVPPVLEVRRLNHRTTREVPQRACSQPYGGFLSGALSPVVPSPCPSSVSPPFSRLQPAPQWLPASLPNTWPISSFLCFFKSRSHPGASLPSSFQGVLLKREFAALYLELENSLFGLWASWHPKQRGEIAITRFTVLINS